jgi:hypothetical protein
MRATSCEEGLEARRLKVKGILKKRKSDEEAPRYLPVFIHCMSGKGSRGQVAEGEGHPQETEE